jgi:DNA-binding MarR family transcriptional regulator
MVRIELSAAGHRLVTKIRSNQVEVCRSMLALLDPQDRESLIRLVSQLAKA